MESSGNNSAIRVKSAPKDGFAGRLLKQPAFVVVILGLLLFVVGGIYRPESVNMQAVGAILFSTATLTFAAGAQTLVIISGSIDFTVGTVMSCSALIAVHIMNGVPGRFFQVVVVSLLMGMTVGFINGISVVKIGLPSMIVTMAIGNVVTRLSYVFTAGNPTGRASVEFRRSIIMRLGDWFPIIIIYALSFWAVIFYILNFSRFGRQIYLVGNNPVAANLCGVKVNKIRIVTYMISGMIAALAGIIAMGYSGTASCQRYDANSFQSLVAVIVGGTSFAGGVGSYYGTIAGAFMMTVLSNTLTVFNFTPELANIVNGVVMIILLITYSGGRRVRQ